MLPILPDFLAPKLTKEEKLSMPLVPPAAGGEVREPSSRRFPAVGGLVDAGLLGVVDWGVSEGDERNDV